MASLSSEPVARVWRYSVGRCIASADGAFLCPTKEAGHGSAAKQRVAFCGPMTDAFHGPVYCKSCTSALSAIRIGLCAGWVLRFRVTLGALLHWSSTTRRTMISAARELLRLAAGHIDLIAERLADLGVRRLALAGGLAPSIEPWLAPATRKLLVPAEGDALSGALNLARQELTAAQLKRV